MASRTEARDARIKAQAQAQVDAAILTTAKADAFVQQFIAMTPAEIDAYITANVVDLVSARQLLKKLALMLLLLARREFGK